MKKRRGLLTAICLLTLSACSSLDIFGGDYQKEVEAMTNPDWFLGYASHQAYLVFNFDYDKIEKKFHRKADRDQLVYEALEDAEFQSYAKPSEESWEYDLDIDSGYGGGDDEGCFLSLSKDYTKVMITASKGDLFASSFSAKYYLIDLEKGKAVYQAALTSQEKYPEDVDR
jgi:hypothetical protein